MIDLIQTATQPTPAEQILTQSQQQATNILTHLRNVTVGTFKTFWDGPVPVEDLLATMGTKAAAAFGRHAAAVQFLLSQGITMPPEDYTPPRAFTVHEDGTVTLD